LLLAEKKEDAYYEKGQRRRKAVKCI